MFYRLYLQLHTYNIQFANEYICCAQIFPPLVSGVTITLIGAALIGTGMQYWGGGVFCALNVNGLPGSALGHCTYTNMTTGVSTVAINSFTGLNETCFSPAIPIACSGNGDVKLPFGSSAYLGLGFLVFAVLVFVELFG